MYEESISILEQILSDLEKRIKTDNAQIDDLPSGRMMQTESNGKTAVFQVNGRGSARVRRVISKDLELQESLARRALLEFERGKLCQVRSILCDALGRIDALGEQDGLRFLLKKYPWLSDGSISRICSAGIAVPGWENEPYEQSDFMPEKKTMMTSRGLLVRTKSELLIAEALYRHGLRFRYEQVLWLDEKHCVVPDFTIMTADGRVFYWEHRGRMDLVKYQNRQLQKDALYAKAGIVPWKNLIITYDTEDGNIDLRIIEAEICNKLL